MTASPIVLIGTGRCGSTLLHRILARHPDLAYLTPLCSRSPGHPERNGHAMRAVSALPALQSTPLLRRFLAPSEAYPFWERHCPGFSEPCRDLFAHDLRPDVRDRAREAIGRLGGGRRRRLLVKVTGWPRVSYLDALLDEPRFVHIRRDGRGVANSWLGVDWWGGWGGPNTWRWGELSEEQEARWRATDRSFVALAAINWELLMDAAEVARERVGADRYLDITYEDLCADTPAVVDRVLDFASLDRPSSFARHVASVSTRNANDAWRRQLTAEQQEVLERTIEGALRRYGYG